MFVRRTIFGQFDELCFVLNWLIMRCKLRSELAAETQQTAWSKLKSIYFSHPSQGNLTNCYIILGPRDKATPSTSQQIGQFPPKRVKYRHRSVIHLYSYFFLIHRRALLSANQRQCSSNRANIPRTCRKKVLDPEYSFIVFNEYPDLYSRSKSSSN